jgi:hypothetical protein
MKKILLSLALFATTISFSQTLESENFNSLILGNIGTDATGVTAGQASYLTGSSNGTAPTTSTNAGITNYQVVADGNNSTKGLQITSPNGDQGSRFMCNNIIEVEYDFFTGPITDSRTQIGIRIFGTEDVAGVPTSRSLNGFVYTTNTRVLTGVAYIQNGATKGTFLINLAAGGLLLDANTWYSIGCSYNTVTGEMLWKTSPTAGASGLGVANWVPGLLPTEVDFVQVVVGANAAAVPPVPANTVTSNIIFDNYSARAVATSNLLNAEDFATIGSETVSIYPNPTKDILNLKVAGLEMISAIQIVDLNGRQIVTKTFNNVSDAQVNVSDLSAGMYLVNITSGDQTVTRKFLKQ